VANRFCDAQVRESNSRRSIQCNPALHPNVDNPARLAGPRPLGTSLCHSRKLDGAAEDSSQNGRKSNLFSEVKLPSPWMSTNLARACIHRNLKSARNSVLIFRASCQSGHFGVHLSRAALTLFWAGRNRCTASLRRSAPPRRNTRLPTSRGATLKRSTSYPFPPLTGL
jgi:hypothetical protein